MTWIGKSYVNLAISPLFRDFIISNPCLIDIGFGDHHFKVKCDQTVYMVPIDAEGLSRFAEGQSFTIKNKVDPNLTYPFYEKFRGDEEFEKLFAFKLGPGKLFKKKGEEWIEQEL